MKSFADASVARVFSDYPPLERKKLFQLRELIFMTAASASSIGALEERLKWGQASYLTSETKSGTTIRIDAIRALPGNCAIYFHCQTTLMESFKQKFGAKFRYAGNRALIFSCAGELAETELSECIFLALTYHLKKKGRRISIGQLIR